MNITDAWTRLERMVAADVEPTLEPAVVSDLLDLAKRPDRDGNDPRNADAAADRASTTTYTPGDHVQQAVGVERWWICLIGGISASTAPTWPTLTTYSRTDNTVVDGSVTWIDAGSRWAPTWNLNTAAAEGWEVKAAQLIGKFDFATDGQSFDRSQQFDHCLKMAERFRNRQSGSVAF